MPRLALSLTVLAVLAGCVAAPPPSSRPVPPGPATTPPQSAQTTAFDPQAVSRRVEPVAEAMCRRRLPDANCDFLILVDTRRGQPANAFQTLNRQGRPVLIVTQALVEDMRNADEMAFVLGHEAAHHIEGHLPETNQRAVIGALSAGLLIAAAGGNAAAIESAQQTGAFVGARSYSKQYELEADALGTLIAARSGYDPVVGAEFFSRLPDPGNQFLGSHPPNADRQRIVRQTAAQIR
ncbi:MAG: M48 family metalloprotease [Pseudomonadota bacterium]